MVLADEIGDVSLQLPAAYGQWVAPYIAGTRTAALADRYVALADAQPEIGPRLVGMRMLGLERFHAGRFKESLALVTQAVEGHDPAAHRDLALRYGHDSRAASASYQGWNLWVLGFPDQAARRIDDGLRFAREVNHANTTGLVLCYGATLAYIWLRRPDRVEANAREALRLAEDNSMALWRPAALIQLGWALSQQGTASGIEQIEAGLSDLDQMGARRLECLYVGLAVEAYARAGRREDAEAAIARAFTLFSAVQERSLESEFHRLRAAVAQDGNAEQRSAAEADLRRAMEIAQRQEALSLELRAARDLARMLAERRERQQATDLLAPVYGRFTEGFGTPDLKDAKVLLDTLGT
jgi:hypothetical protein